MSQTDLHWERHLKDLSETSQKRRLFWGVFKTSQIHLKKDVFFETSLKRLKYISKKMFFLWRLKYISKKMFFQVTSLRRLKLISRKMFILWRLWYVPKIYLESICDYSKISHKNGFVLIKSMCGRWKHSKNETSFSKSNA